jgi:hypothetical protein
MNADIFADWLRLQGHRVVRTPSSYWVEIGPRIYQAFPYHWVIQPSKQELSELLFRERAIGLRYSTPLGSKSGKISYHVVFDGSTYNIDTLSANERRNIRRGLKRCQIERITMRRLATDGWTLQKETIERQGRTDCMSENEWQRICLTAEDLPGFEAWGATVEGKLVASMLIGQIGDSYSLLYSQSSSEHFRNKVNTVLMFAISCELLSRSGTQMILSGIQSLDAPPSVDEFKFRLGYRAKPVRQRVVFHPWLAPLFNPVSHAALKQLRRLRPGSPFLAKTEGMIRFYLEGRQPLDKQSWSPHLADVREEILQA